MHKHPVLRIFFAATVFFAAARSVCSAGTLPLRGVIQQGGTAYEPAVKRDGDFARSNVGAAKCAGAGSH